MNTKQVAISLIAACLCCACPGRQKVYPKWDEPQSAPVAVQDEPVVSYFNICVLPDAMPVDEQLPEIAEAVADYWTGEGYPMRVVQPGENCLAVIDVNEVALAESGWGFKEAQTWIPNTITETNPVIARFRLGFWTDPLTSLELKAALIAHEFWHVFFGAEHEVEHTGKLGSAIVTEELAQELFGEAFGKELENGKTDVE